MNSHVVIIPLLFYMWLHLIHNILFLITGNNEQSINRPVKRCWMKQRQHTTMGDQRVYENIFVKALIQSSLCLDFSLWVVETSSRFPLPILNLTVRLRVSDVVMSTFSKGLESWRWRFWGFVYNSDIWASCLVWTSEKSSSRHLWKLGLPHVTLYRTFKMHCLICLRGLLQSVREQYVNMVG